MTVPTVTIDELSKAINDAKYGAATMKVLEAILNDYMDLQYGKETPYTTGRQVLPTETTISDVDTAAADEKADKKFRDIFAKISQTFKKGDLTPQSPVDGWDPKLRPVLVVVTPNKG